MTPEWEHSARSGDIDGLERGLGAGLSVDALDRYGQTTLMLAALHGHGPMVEWLVGHGADLDHTAKYRLSALMLAALNGHRDIVAVLVAAGADQTLRGSGAPGFAGKTASDLAVDQGHDEIGELLWSDAGDPQAG